MAIHILYPNFYKIVLGYPEIDYYQTLSDINLTMTNSSPSYDYYKNFVITGKVEIKMKLWDVELFEELAGDIIYIYFYEELEAGLIDLLDYGIIVQFMGSLRTFASGKNTVNFLKRFGAIRTEELFRIAFRNDKELTRELVQIIMFIIEDSSMEDRLDILSVLGKKLLIELTEYDRDNSTADDDFYFSYDEKKVIVTVDRTF